MLVTGVTILYVENHCQKCKTSTSCKEDTVVLLKKLYIYGPSKTANVEKYTEIYLQIRIRFT